MFQKKTIAARAICIRGTALAGTKRKAARSPPAPASRRGRLQDRKGL